VQCVAVARHKRDETEVDVDGKIFEPEGVCFGPKGARTHDLPYTS
jgi:hypothetical protein